MKNKHTASAIGIIGGADGPTAVFIGKQEKHEDFIAYAAAKVIPCDRSLEDLEAYLVDKYQAASHELLSHELDTFKANVIMNFFDYVIDKPEPLGPNPTIEQIKAYAESDTSFFQARQYPAEKLGLEMKTFILPNARTVEIHETARHNSGNNAHRHVSYGENDVIVELEKKTGYLSIINGNQEIADDLLLFQGVSEKDIVNRTPRFMAYAYALKHMGRL